MTDITPGIVAARLSENAEESARWLLPNGRRVGNDWCVGSIKGEPGNSLKVCIEGENRGRWADFAEGDLSGDLIDLIAATQEVSLGKALGLACKQLGIERAEWGNRTKEKYAEPERPKDARAIGKAPVVAAWLATRKISPEVQTKFKLVADGDGVIVFPYFREGRLLHLKYRSVREKKFWSSAGTENCLFGWQGLEAKTRAVILVEGEMDALALAQYGFQALSIPFGAGKKGKQDWIENEWEHLERFDTIYIAIDMDGPGIQTVQELAERLGRPRCRYVKLPRKDANACLMEGVEKREISEAIRVSKTLDPVELRNATDFTDEVMDRFHPKDRSTQGFFMPWISMADSFRFGWGETTVIAGHSGHGKSELVGQFILDAIRQGVRACVGSFEFKSSKWLQRQIRQATAQELPAPALIQQAMSWIGASLWAVDLYGSAKADRLLEIFEYAHRRYGCRLFVIDNLTKLGIPDTGDAGLAEQKRVMNAITEFAVRFNVHVVLVHHLRKVETDYTPVGMSKQGLKGSSTIGDLADNIFLMYRNRTKEAKLKESSFNSLTPEEQAEIRARYDSLLTCEKWRNGDDEPRIGLWFCRRAHMWMDEQGAPVHVYVKDASIEEPKTRTVIKTYQLKKAEPTVSATVHSEVTSDDEVPA